LKTLLDLLAKNIGVLEKNGLFEYSPSPKYVVNENNLSQNVNSDYQEVEEVQE